MFHKRQDLVCVHETQKQQMCPGTISQVWRFSLLITFFLLFVVVGATKRAFLAFMGIDSRSKEHDVNFYSKPPAGIYTGMVHGNRTVTVEGSRSTSGQWVARSAIGGGVKRDGFQKMNITNYQAVNKQPSGKSCIMQLHDFYAQQQHDPIQILRRRRW